MAKILLVDDETIILFVKCAVLEKEGHQVTQAVNAQEALEALRKERFNLLITDIQMPGTNGIQLIKEIRRTDQKLLIMATSANQRDNEIPAIDAGADLFLPKSCDNGDFTKTVAAVLERVRIIAA